MTRENLYEAREICQNLHVKGTMTSPFLLSRLGKLILVLFNNANSNDYHRRFVMKVELDSH